MTTSTKNYDGQERREHNCIQEENIGKFKEFMQSTKGFKTTLFTISLAIFVQVGGFLYLWGGLSEIVHKNTSYLWGEVAPLVRENTRNIDRILSKMDSIKIIAVEKADAHGQSRI